MTHSASQGGEVSVTHGQYLLSAEAGRVKKQRFYTAPYQLLLRV